MYMTSDNTSIWAWIIKKFFIIPSVDKIDASNALVYTLDENLQYIPLQQEMAVSMKVQMIWLFIYIMLWAIVIIPKSTTTYSAYFFGFFSGLIIILIESFYYSTISSIDYIRNPAKPYILNTPQVKNIKTGTKIKNPNSYLQFAPGQGDYKVLINNKTLPKDGIHGYLFQADTFINESAKGTLESIDLEDFLSNTHNNELKHRFKPSSQASIKYFAERERIESWAAYYIAIILLTWAMYITGSKGGTRIQLLWTILSFLIAIIAGSTVMFSTNILNYNYILYVRKRLLILAISFGITSIFIID